MILICTIDGQISKPSMETGTLNSINLFCNALAFSIRKVSFMVVVSVFLVNIDAEKVGLSDEKLTGCLKTFSCFSSIFCLSFCLNIHFIMSESVLFSGKIFLSISGLVFWLSSVFLTCEIF